MDTKTSWHEADGEGAPMSIFVAEPEAPGTYPAIMMFHTLTGVNQNLQNMAQRFASDGFVVAAPDLYYRWGRRTIFANDEKGTANSKAQPFLAKMNDFGLSQDIRVLIGHLKRLPNVGQQKIGCVGYCFGGRISFLAGCFNADLSAVVVCYGSRVARHTPSVDHPVLPLEMADRIAAPMMSLSGDQDLDPSPEDIENIDATMKRLGKSFEYRIFPGAGHAFFSEDYPERYHPPSVEAGWPVKIGFFKRHLQGVTAAAGRS